MKKSVAIALAICSLVCCVLTVVSLATSDWVNYSNGKVKLGLFKVCDPVFGCNESK